ncbi:hypothetical protein [Bartonella taylorii]|uniref:hypothetical protein n=1 Tax=Bartonella taylorii TaxID=33046 RepID=UPI001ABBB6F4|nr:hypothetical protein [Bartonella taylorii]
MLDLNHVLLNLPPRKQLKPPPSKPLKSAQILPPNAQKLQKRIEDLLNKHPKLFKDAYKRENNDDEFKCTVVGYLVEKREYPIKNNNDGKISSQDVAYLYLNDGRVLFVTAHTALRDFFEIVNQFGLPSDNKGLNISISLIKKDKSWYMMKILGAGIDNEHQY